MQDPQRWCALLPQDATEDPGSTATTVVVTTTHIVFANLGDSRAFLVRGGRITFVTQDHKPESQLELERIERVCTDLDVPLRPRASPVPCLRHVALEIAQPGTSLAVSRDVMCVCVWQAGGFVARNRVCNCLAVSRAFGDHLFKDRSTIKEPEKLMVSPVPVRLYSPPSTRQAGHVARAWLRHRSLVLSRVVAEPPRPE